MIRIPQGLALYALFAMPAFAGDPTQAATQDRAAVEQKMCAEVGCQRDLHVVMKQKDGSTFDRTFAVFSPIVQPMGITVVAGQTVYVEADIVDGKLAHLVAVDAIRDPARTIVSTLTQDEKGGMMLHTTSPFPQALKFDMGMMPLDGEHLLKTSSCPMHGGSFEIWGEPLFLVVLGNGRVLADSDDASYVCD